MTALGASDVELVDNGVFTKLKKAPPADNWQREGGGVCRLVDDPVAGGTCLEFAAKTGEIPAGQSTSIFTRLNAKPSSSRLLLAVEARGQGKLRLKVFEYGGTVEKAEFLRGDVSPTMELTPDWRWHFFECNLQNLAKLSLASAWVSLQPQEGEALQAMVRTVRAAPLEPVAEMTPAEDVPTELVVPALPSPAKLTGDLSDPVWNKATRFSGFIAIKDVQRRFSGRGNEVFLFHDRDALYVGLRSKVLRNHPLVFKPHERDNPIPIYMDDNFELGVVPPAADKMYQFIVNAANSIYDGTFDKVNFSGAWNSQVETRASVTPETFCLEMRIPAKDLGVGNVKPGDVWCLAVVRNYRCEQVVYEDHLTPLKKFFADWERFAQLVMMPDETAVDVENGGYSCGRPVFRITPRGSTGETSFTRALADLSVDRLRQAPKNQEFLSSAPEDIAAGKPAFVNAALSYREKNHYRVSLLLKRKSDGQTLARFARAFSVLPPLALKTEIDCIKQTVKVEADGRGLPPPDGIQKQTLAALVEIEKKDDPRVLTSATLTMDAGDTGVVTLPIKDMKDGVHLVDCTVRNAKRYLLAEAIEPIRLYKDQYWLNNGLGEEDVVPRPFVAPQYKEAEGMLENWGHRVKLGKNGLPEQIWVEGTPLLAGPVELKGKVNGKDYALTTAVKREPGQRVSNVALAGKSKAGGVETELRLNFEYDGMLRADVELKGTKKFQIDELALRIPLRQETADVLQTCSGMHTDAGNGTFGMLFLKDMEFTKDGYWVDMSDPPKSGMDQWNRKFFWPIITLMNMDRGLTWFTESDEHWSVGEGHDRYVLERDGDKTVLVIRLVDTPVTVERWPLTFGLQPNPVRPYDKKTEQEMWHRRFQYAAAIDDPNDFNTLQRPDITMLHVTNPGGGIMPLDTPHMRKLLIMDPWIVMHHAPDEGSQRMIFRRTEEFWAQEGRRLCMYNNTSFTWWDSPEYQYFKELWGMEKPGQFWEWEMVELTRSCPSWQDYYIYHFYQILKRYPENYFGFDCTTVQSDTRAINGMGYERNGKRHPTLNIFGSRRMFKRIYVIADQLRKDPFVWLHACPWLSATIGFCHGTGCGEEWRGWKRHQFEHPGRTLDVFRYDCANRLGPARDFMVQAGYGSKERTVHGIGMCFLHNLSFTDANNDVRLTAEACAVMDRFGLGRREDAEFHPYWKPDPRVTADAPRFKTSFWTKSDGAMVIVANVNWDQATSGTVEIDAAGLGLKQPKVSVYDPMTNRYSEVPPTDGKLRVKLDIPAALYDIILLETK